MKIEDVLFGVIEEKIGVTKKEILSKSRLSNIVDARRIFAVILFRSSSLTLMRVGKRVDRDHSTVVFYNKSHNSLVKTDKFFREKYNSINEEFKELMRSSIPLEIRLVKAIEDREKIDKEIVKLKELIEIKKEQLSSV